MTPVEELTAAAKQLSAAAAGADAETIAEPLNALDIAAKEIVIAQALVVGLRRMQGFGGG
jgi:hypothetical protein